MAKVGTPFFFCPDCDSKAEAITAALQRGAVPNYGLASGPVFPSHLNVPSGPRAMAMSGSSAGTTGSYGNVSPVSMSSPTGTFGADVAGSFTSQPRQMMNGTSTPFGTVRARPTATSSRQAPVHEPVQSAAAFGTPSWASDRASSPVQPSRLLPGAFTRSGPQQGTQPLRYTAASPPNLQTAGADRRSFDSAGSLPRRLGKQRVMRHGQAWLSAIRNCRQAAAWLAIDPV